MHITLHPVRPHRSRWIDTTPEKAAAWELRQPNGAVLLTRHGRRIQSKTEAERMLRVLAPRQRSREAMLGCRYSEVQEEVAARTPRVLARSLYEHERS